MSCADLFGDLSRHDVHDWSRMFVWIAEKVIVVILLAITWRLVRQRPKVKPRHRGFDLLLLGMVLVTLGAAMDALDLEKISLTSESFGAQSLVFVELVLGYVLGILLVGIGLILWLPSLISNQEQVRARLDAEHELRRSADELEARNQSLALINDLTGSLHGTHKIEAIAAEAVKALVRSTDPPAVAFYLLSQDTRFLRLITSHGFHDAATKHGIKLEIGTSLSGIAMSRRELVQSSPISTDERLDPIARQHLVEGGFETAVIVPLFYRSQALGTLNLLFRESRTLDDQELYNLQAIGQTVSLAIVNGRNFANLEYRAFHDSLTGLPNREQLHHKLEAILLSASRGGQQTGLILFDLDHFKEINDSLGHHLGDELLIEIGKRIGAEMRDRSATLCRLGGDEFAILIPRIATVESAEEIARSILQLFSQPFEVQGTAIQVGASLGITTSPDHADDSHELLRCADIAMYRAKANASGFAVYQRELDRHTPERLALVAELGDAIHSNKMRLHFQPKISLRENRIVGFEALIRWQHPRLGLLMPDAFVPLAELSNVIHPMTTWVVNAAAAQLQKWNQRGMNVSMAVNLSTRNLLDNGLAAEIGAILDHHGVNPTDMEFELTETVLMSDPELAAGNLAGITNAGSRLAVDDFGTGYSSLALLRRFPIHSLKIDRSFVTDLLTDEQSQSIVRSTVTLGHALGLEVVAEGVENPETTDALHEMGCDLAQGYTFSRPKPAEEIEQWLREPNGFVM